MPPVALRRPQSRAANPGPAPSAEQQSFIDCPADRIVLQAPAGTGKTTTIKHRIDAIVKDGGTVSLFTFDRANAQEAKNRIKHPNVTIQTFNSLAYRLIGSSHKERFVPELSTFDLTSLLDWKYLHIPPQSRQLVAAVVLMTYRKFCSSGHKAIGLQHLPDILGCEGYAFDPDMIIKLATQTFNDQLNKRSWPMTHDCALKAMHLRGYDLGVSEVIIDEAQDTSPVCLSFATNQKNSSLALIGDKHQSIYLFRGAINAMARLERATEIKLTQSHRFGRRIANTAQRTLNLAKNDLFRLKGTKSKDHVFVYDKTSPKDPEALPYHYLKYIRTQAIEGRSVLILCRSLLGIASASLVFMEENNNNMNRYCGFKLAGGVKRYNLGLLTDVAVLGMGKKPDNPFLSTFTSYGELEEYSNIAGDQELASAVSFSKRHKGAAYGIIKSVRKYNLETAMRRENGGRLPHHSKVPPHVTISSAHRSKGLEADIVVVWDDYKIWASLIEGYTDYTDKESRNEYEQEINLVYVAVTRAKRLLFLPRKLSAIVDPKDISQLFP